MDSAWRLLLAAAVLSGPLSATPTVGWKVSSGLLDQIAPQWRDSLHPLDRPPGDSAFFQPGDELRDLTTTLRSQLDASIRQRLPDDFPLPSRATAPDGWIIWDQRSGLLIARGYWDEILAIESLLGLDGSQDKPASPELEVTLEVAAATGTALHHTSFRISPAGAKTLSQDDMAVEMEVNLNQDRIDHLSASVKWDDGSSKWNYTGTFLMREDQITTVAKAGSGAEAWTLTAKTQRVMPDGSPFTGSRLIEREGGVSPLEASPPWRIRQSLGGGRSLTVFDMPFALGYVLPLQELGLLKIPAELAGELPPKLADARLEEIAPALKEKNLIGGIDRMTGQLYVAGDDNALKEVEQLLAETLTRRMQLWTFTSEAGGGWGALCESGEKVVIKRTSSGTKDRSFSIEPTIGSANWFIDAAYSLTMPGGAELESCTTMESEQAVEIAAFAVAGEMKSVTLGATILKLDDR